MLKVIGTFTVLPALAPEGAVNAVVTSAMEVMAVVPLALSEAALPP